MSPSCSTCPGARGDQAALDSADPVIRRSCHRLAALHGGESGGHLLQPTALVNEAYLRLVLEGRAGGRTAPTSSPWRRRSCGACWWTWRAGATAPSAAGQLHVSLSRSAGAAPGRTSISSRSTTRSRRSQALDPRQSRVVELRFFAGLSLEEAAHVLDVSVGTVRRDWSLAHAWLFRELGGGK